MVGSGRTLAEARNEIASITPRRLFLAHTRVLLLDEALTRDGVSKVLDHLIRNREVRREIVWIFVAVDDPIVILDVPAPIAICSADRIDQIMRARLPGQYFPRVRLTEFLREMEAEGADPFAPLIALASNEAFQQVTRLPQDPSPEPLHNIKIEGTGVFRGDRLVGFLNRSQTQGLLFARGEALQGRFVFVEPEMDCLITVGQLRNRGSVIPRLGEDGRIAAEIRVEFEVFLEQIECNLDVGQPDVMQRLEELLANQIREQIYSALAVSRRTGSDFFGLGSAVHRADPARWKEVRERWRDEFLPTIDIDVIVEGRIRDTGTIVKPLEPPLR
ncbi:MAG: Ger(x)C family spore germination protein [Firmicutes bacterium]|nr:Ger(x)C family spore germination protein [Bacillota bacterium]MBU4553429.1 Ger(x)C family spore germination protein [Bacillota bacterium]